MGGRGEGSEGPKLGPNVSHLPLMGGGGHHHRPPNRVAGVRLGRGCPSAGRPAGAWVLGPEKKPFLP